MEYAFLIFLLLVLIAAAGGFLRAVRDERRQKDL